MPIRYICMLMLILFFATSSSFAAEDELKTIEQKFSYTLGYTFGQQMKGQVVEVEKAALIEAIEDVFAARQPKISREVMTDTLTAVKAKINQMNQEQAQLNLEAGKKFMEENKKKEGIVVLPNGIQYLEQTKGEGESPKSDSDVTVHYVGTHINGSVFDSSKRHGGPATFNLARVIPGFRDAISKMNKGAKWQVFIPSEQAYGVAGSPPAINANETLIFEIELISFQDTKPAEAAAK